MAFNLPLYFTTIDILLDKAEHVCEGKLCKLYMLNNIYVCTNIRTFFPALTSRSKIELCNQRVK